MLFSVAGMTRLEKFFNLRVLDTEDWTTISEDYESMRVAEKEDAWKRLIDEGRFLGHFWVYNGVGRLHLYPGPEYGNLYLGFQASGVLTVDDRLENDEGGHTFIEHFKGKWHWEGKKIHVTKGYIEDHVKDSSYLVSQLSAVFEKTGLFLLSKDQVEGSMPATY